MVMTVGSCPSVNIFTHEMVVVSHFLINTLLQRGVLRGAKTQNRFNFNGFYALSKTAEAVRTTPPHSYTPLKQGVNEKNPLKWLWFVKYWSKHKAFAKLTVRRCAGNSAKRRF